MQHKKRFLLLLVLSLLSMILLAGCGGAKPSISPRNDPNEGLGGGGYNEDAVNDFSAYKGIWLGEAKNKYDSLEIDEEGNWTLYLSGNAVDYGYLRYEPEWEGVYAYSSRDDSGSRLERQGERLYSTAYGYFNRGEGMEYLSYEQDSGSRRLTEDDETDPPEYPEYNAAEQNSYYSWDSELCQRNVIEFEGVWYYDGDLAAETYIVIDGSGSWSYYQRAPGAEPAEMDCGIFTYSTDETSVYYADSVKYDGVSYRVFEFDSDVLVWGDEGPYYRME